MKLFLPERAFFEPSSLGYPLGRKLMRRLSELDVEILQLPLQSVARHIPGKSEGERYARSKKTLVVSVKKGVNLDVCKPSADFEFSLVSNCPGNCEYCYLQTTQGPKPYLRVYVNLEDIFDTILHHIHKNQKTPPSPASPVKAIAADRRRNDESDDNPRLTVFEAASMGDPLALEHLTGSLARTIEFFGTLEDARLRVVTKYDNVDSLLDLKHNGHTRFRFSINSRYVIETFEHNTATFDERLAAASKIASSGYPIGFIAAPIMVYEDWKEQYTELFDRLQRSLAGMTSSRPVTFELIQHRFTATAKDYILQRFPNTRLDLDEENRALKWGRFGRYKYVYKKETSQEIREFISTLIHGRFPDAVIEYFT